MTSRELVAAGVVAGAGALAATRACTGNNCSMANNNVESNLGANNIPIPNNDFNLPNASPGLSEGQRQQYLKHRRISALETEAASRKARNARLHAKVERLESAKDRHLSRAAATSGTGGSAEMSVAAGGGGDSFDDGSGSDDSFYQLSTEPISLDIEIATMLGVSLYEPNDDTQLQSYVMKEDGTFDRLQNCYNDFAGKITTLIGIPFEIYKDSSLLKETAFAARKYSYHFDTILNGIMRNRDITNKIYKYFENDYLRRTWDWDDSFTAYPYYGGPCNSLQYPIKYDDRLKGNLNQYEYYVTRLFEETISLYNNMKKYSLKLPKELYVYRGIYLEDDKKLDTKMIGFTSTSYDIRMAIYMMMTDYENDGEALYSKNFRLLKIKLPVNTKYFTTNICTIKEEREIVLTDEGSLINVSKQKLRFTPLLPYKNDDDVIIYNFMRKGPITIPLIIGTFEPESTTRGIDFTKVKRKAIESFTASSAPRRAAAGGEGYS